MASEVVTLGGGCFWCLQPIFQDVRGVERVECGYAGGTVQDPSYEQVCTGTTGHAEVVNVNSDPAVVSFEELLRVFFAVHDPTTPNRQGEDVGTQYRSAVFYRSTEQRSVAERVVAELDETGTWGRPIVTEIAPLSEFFRAEEYHQDYFEKNPHSGYCMAVIAPKVDKFRKEFQHKVKG